MTCRVYAGTQTCIQAQYAHDATLVSWRICRRQVVYVSVVVVKGTQAGTFQPLLACAGIPVICRKGLRVCV